MRSIFKLKHKLDSKENYFENWYVICRKKSIDSWKLIVFFFFVLLTGPAFWGLINPQWSLCSKGRRQSPINIEPDKLLFDRHLRPVLVDKHKVIYPLFPFLPLFSPSLLPFLFLFSFSFNSRCGTLTTETIQNRIQK